MDGIVDHWELVEAFAAQRGLAGFPAEEILGAYVENQSEEEMDQRLEEERRLQRLHAEICNYTGAKYDPDLDIAEIVRRVCGEIQQRFPHLKPSVRIARFAGGTNLYVDVLSDATDDEMDDIMETVEAYNFDRSGYNDEYSHNNFFESISRQGIHGFWGRRRRQVAREWSRAMGWDRRVLPEAEETVNWQKEGF